MTPVIYELGVAGTGAALSEPGQVTTKGIPTVADLLPIFAACSGV